MPNGHTTQAHSLTLDIPACAYCKNKAGEYTAYNQMYADFIGLQKEQSLLGQTDQTLKLQKKNTDDCDLITFTNHQRTVSKNIKSTLSGTTYRATVHKEPLFNNQQECDQILVSFFPPTPEETLTHFISHNNQASPAYFSPSLILSHAPFGLYWKDRQGRYLGCNQICAKTMHHAAGYACPIIGQTDDDIYDEETAHTFSSNDQTVMVTGKLTTFHETATIQGTPTTYISNKIPLRDYKNNIIGVLGASIDITALVEKEQLLLSEKQHAENKQRDTELYFKNIISHLPDHIFWVDRNNFVLGCNNQQATSCGLSSPDELIGRSIQSIGEQLQWPDSVTESLLKNNQDVLDTEKEFTFEEGAIFVDGKKRCFLSKKLPLRNSEGDCIGVLGSAIEITDLKEMENQLRESKEAAEHSNTLTSRFIANISHDLRTPLHTVIGTTDLLTLLNNNTQEKEHLYSISQAAQTLLSLVDNILDYTALKDQSQLSQITHFDLYMMMKEALNHIKSQQKKKDVLITLKYGADVPTHITSDRFIFNRIILNLLSNALKFTDSGHITLTTQLSPDSHNTLLLSISDTGIGIPADKVTQVFDRFYRVNPAYKGQYEGTGLGLSIVKELLLRLNGDITCESIEGQGATFTCTIPLTNETNSIRPSQTEPSQLNLSRFQSPCHILLVEDSKSIQKFTATLLEMMGATVTVVGTAAAACHRAEHPLDLIMMDIGLPDQDGLWATRYILKNCPENADTPIIALTAHANTSIKEECLKAGMVDVLIKPCSYRDLIQCLTKHLRLTCSPA